MREMWGGTGGKWAATGVNPVTSDGLSYADPPAGLGALFDIANDRYAIASLRSGAMAQ